MKPLCCGSKDFVAIVLIVPKGSEDDQVVQTLVPSSLAQGL